MKEAGKNDLLIFLSLSLSRFHSLSRLFFFSPPSFLPLSFPPILHLIFFSSLPLPLYPSPPFKEMDQIPESNNFASNITSSAPINTPGSHPA